jgi:hypothetical protein
MTPIIIDPNKLTVEDDHWYTQSYCQCCRRITKFNLMLTTRHNFIEQYYSVPDREDYWYSECTVCEREYNKAILLTPLIRLAMRFK